MPISGIIVPILGMTSGSTPSRRRSLADALFTRTQQRVLGVLFGRPDRSFYASELIQVTRAPGCRSSAQRELARLERSGLMVGYAGLAIRSITRPTRPRRCMRNCGVSC